jgi:hypothetical protein
MYYRPTESAYIWNVFLKNSRAVGHVRDAQMNNSLLSRRGGRNREYPIKPVFILKQKHEALKHAETCTLEARFM